MNSKLIKLVINNDVMNTNSANTLSEPMLDILLIWPPETTFSEMLIEIYTFSFKKMHLKTVFAKITAILSRSQCVNSLRPSDAYMRQ